MTLQLKLSKIFLVHPLQSNLSHIFSDYWSNEPHSQFKSSSKFFFHERFFSSTSVLDANTTTCTILTSYYFSSWDVNLIQMLLNLPPSLFFETRTLPLYDCNYSTSRNFPLWQLLVTFWQILLNSIFIFFHLIVPLMPLFLFLLSKKVRLNLRGHPYCPLIFCLDLSSPAKRHTLETIYLSIPLLNVIVFSSTLKV